MKRKDLMKYEGLSVRLSYTKIGEKHSRTGTLYAIGLKSVMFFPLDDDEEDIEMIIKIDSADEKINRVRTLKGMNE